VIPVGVIRISIDIRRAKPLLLTKKDRTGDDQKGDYRAGIENPST